MKFEDRTFIGRNNCKKFGTDGYRKNVNGPTFGWDYKLKVKYQALIRRYNDDYKFERNVNAVCIFSSTIILVVTVITYGLYCFLTYYKK